MSNYPPYPTTTTSTIDVSSGTDLVVSSGAFVTDQAGAQNDGTITIAGRLSVAGDYTGSGSVVVTDGGRIGIGGAADNTGFISFSGNADVLDEDTPGTFTPVLQGLSAGDRIALSPISAVGAASATITPLSAGYEQVSYSGTASGGGVDVFTFTVATASLPANAAFIAQPSQVNMVGIDLLVTCFLAGTLIRTPSGDRPVEALAIGDAVTTVAGAAKPIRWIGRRSYAGRFLASNPAAQPVLVRKGALAAGLPVRDLYVSPTHALAIDGLLIPAQCLVNGSTILRCTDMARVDYLHLELHDHDLVLAEGVAAETFLDDDSRAAFQNAYEYPEADAPSAQQSSCLPRLESGYELETIRRRLALRAGLLAA